MLAPKDEDLDVKLEDVTGCDRNVTEAFPPNHPESILAPLRNRLLDSGLYLASASFQDTVTWYDEGRRKRLVEKAEVAAVEERYRAALATDRVLPTAQPRDAISSVIVHITDEEFWLMPEGGFRGPPESVATLGDLQLSCTGRAPDVAYLRHDFEAALNNLEYVINVGARENAVTSGLVVEREGVKKLEVRHIPFVVSSIIVRLVVSLLKSICSRVGERGNQRAPGCAR